MILLILFVYSAHSCLQSNGAPVASPADTSATLAGETPQFLTNYRSMVQIFWTCWAVIFASTWVCVHPNVPGHNSGRWERWGIRGRLFLNTLIWPDQSIGTAFRQWRGASLIFSEMVRRRGLSQGKADPPHNDEFDIKPTGDEGEEPETAEITTSLGGAPYRDWTIVHAHFVQMGGVAFKGANGGVWYKDFDTWTDDDIQAFFALRLSVMEIQDRSKADTLAKVFVVVQCLWFVVQCIGRAAFRLPVIELEITSLAYIACNVGMYAFWWNKPLNVVCPVVIRSKTGQPTAEDTPAQIGFVDWIWAMFMTLLNGDIGWIIFPSRGQDNFIPDALSPRFPVNYYYGTFGRFAELLINMIPLAIFGALHAIAWFSPFPSKAEKILWRASSVTPAVLALVLSLFTAAMEYKGKLWAQDLTLRLYFIVVPLPLIVCFAARLAFLVLPAFQLRSLPPLAYQTVPWSDFLPHV